MSRQKHILKVEKALAKKIKELQKMLYQVSSDYLSGLSLGEDKSSNYRLISRLDKIVDDKLSRPIQRMVKWLIDQIKKLSKLNKKYFKELGGNRNQHQQSERKIFQQLGISGGKLVQGGFLSELFNFKSITGTLKRIARAAVVSSIVTFPALKKSLSNTIVGKDKLGLVEKQFYSQANNLMVFIDRSQTTDLAKSVGVRAAIYQGGLIKTSRPFCKSRDGKVFTFDEISAWADLSFQGKPDLYNPFTDCGGYNCRHTLDYISDELAIVLRPELRQIWGI